VGTGKADKTRQDTDSDTDTNTDIHVQNVPHLWGRVGDCAGNT